MKSRFPKSQTQEFTRIATPNGTYELWNSLTSAQENEVIQQLGIAQNSLPLTKKDQQRQRLLFGKGQFGKVRLAKKDGKFVAVKKIKVAASKMDALLRENNFGSLLKAANIPNVIYGSDGVLTTDAAGHETFYLFINDIAALGDGSNLKKLSRYLPTPQRDEILKHAVVSLLTTVAAMHDHLIYHRDIKATNVLVGSAGQFYLSDFGSATTRNNQLIASVLNENLPNYTVTNDTDLRYLNPEYGTAIATKKPLSQRATPSEALLDNWRLGLTILQLSGAIKEGEGILSRMYDSKDSEGNIAQQGWLSELQRVNDDSSLETRIQQHFQTQIDKIKQEALHKVPKALQPIVLGLLETNPEKRLTSQQALALSQTLISIDQTRLQQGIQGLVQNQIIVSVKNGIQKALANEAQENHPDSKWLDDHLLAFKNLLKDSNTTAAALEDFVNHNLSPKFRPPFSITHYEEVLEKLRNHPVLTEQHYASVLIRGDHPKQTTNINTPSVYGDLPPQNHYQPLKVESDYRNLPQPATSNDPVLLRLENAFETASHDLMTYLQSKIPTTGRVMSKFEKIMADTKNGLNQLKKLIYGESLQQAPVTKSSSVDQSAIKAVFARVDQIVNQLTLGKLMQFSQQETTAVANMLVKDKQFLQSIADKVDQKYDTQKVLHKINEKLMLLEKIKQDQYIHASKAVLDSESFSDTQAKNFIARNQQTHTEFSFAESKSKTTYKLPPPYNDAVRGFIAKNTIKELNQANKIYIYTKKEAIGKNIAQAILELDKHNKNLQVFVNDQPIPRANAPSKVFKFFGQDAAPNMAKQFSQFTVEEIPNQDIPFQMK